MTATCGPQPERRVEAARVEALHGGSGGGRGPGSLFSLLGGMVVVGASRRVRLSLLAGACLPAEHYLRSEHTVLCFPGSLSEVKNEMKYRIGPEVKMK